MFPIPSRLYFWLTNQNDFYSRLAEVWGFLWLAVTNIESVPVEIFFGSLFLSSHGILKIICELLDRPHLDQLCNLCNRLFFLKLPRPLCNCNIRAEWLVEKISFLVFIFSRVQFLLFRKTPERNKINEDVFKDISTGFYQRFFICQGFTDNLDRRPSTQKALGLCRSPRLLCHNRIATYRIAVDVADGRRGRWGQCCTRKYP